MAVVTSRTGARSWATATDWVGDACPVDNVDSAVIEADCQMLMNQDQSAYTGLLGVTISGHATTPGMLGFGAREFVEVVAGIPEEPIYGHTPLAGLPKGFRAAA